uniref:Uncharacterized protein n=1 Tax=viral metagenome TaxID=1070528 RepID=A0A6C0KYG8_9ZZZZ
MKKIQNTNNNMKKGAKEWKWSIGEPYQRSARFRKSQEDFDEEKLDFDREMEEYNNINKKSAYEQAFLTENDNWGINYFGSSSSSNSFSLQTTNKREETSNKMAEREMVGQVGFNPFLANNSYIDDVNVQENFLKPISTSSEREKYLENNK